MEKRDEKNALQETPGKGEERGEEEFYVLGTTYNACIFKVWIKLFGSS